MKNILIIHLTDLHIQLKDENLWTQNRANLIARSATRNGNFEAVLLLITGDSSFSGRTEEFKIATKFFEDIAIEIAKITGCQTKIAVAPGNHDCNFSIDSPLRSYALTQKSPSTLINSELIGKLGEPQKNYRDYETRTDTFPFTERVILHKSGIINLENGRIQLRVFNSSLYSKIKEEKGDLFLPLCLFEEGWEENCFRLGVMHHPSPWFDQSISRGIRSALRNNAHIVLYGHEHIPETTAINSYTVNAAVSSIEIDGAVLHEHGESLNSSFITLEINLKTSFINSEIHKWDNFKKCFSVYEIDQMSRPAHWINVPKCRRNFVINPIFEEKISDPGVIAVSNSGRSVKLNDLYVMPDVVKTIKGKNKTEEVFSAKALLNIEKFSGGTIIQGDEKFGKTALLYRLFDEFHNTGLIPLYFSLRDHKIKSSNDFIKIFRTAIKSVYPSEGEDTLLAVPLDQRILLIDDIDVLKTESLRTDFLIFLKEKSGTFFATTTIKTQLAEVLTLDEAGELGQIRNIKIDRFNSLKRSELINKWVSVIENKDEEDDFLARVDTLEKGATAALGHNMVPRVPHMLLIFLQSGSSSSQSKLESGALAHYYSYLVTQHLLVSGIKREEIEEYISFARIISFNMHIAGHTYITSTELEACNKSFSERYFPGSLNTRLNILRNAKLIEDFGADAYQWRHGYFHYLFLGEYLGKNINNSEVRVIVDEMCRHLYVRANANALIFLVHFSKDSSVFNSLQNIIQDLFKNEKKINLDLDIKDFAEIMQDVRNIFIPKEGPIAVRKRHHQRHDENEKKNGDGLLEHRKESSTISTLEEIIVLFKTSEIIGQVLKEQYASIERSIREPMVVALLDAYLRALGKIVRDITFNKILLHKWIDKKIAESENTLTAVERADQAQEFVAELVQMFMFAFFQKIGDSISSDKTLDLVRNIAWPDELEPKVFLLACELNLQRPIPFGNIDLLLKLAVNDAAFIALIRNLVQQRISMFHTRASELQALGERFKLPISSLKAIDFRETRVR